MLMKPGIRKIFCLFLAAAYFFSAAVGSHAAETNFWSERQSALQRTRRTSPTQIAQNGLTPDQIQGLNQLPAAARVDFADPSATAKLSPGEPPSSEPGPIKTLLPRLIPYGAIREVHLSRAPGTPLIINIQDAHGIEEAQRNISGMMRSLQDARALDLVGLEGASGAFALEAFRAYPNPAVTKGIADYFLKEGMISGPEYAGLTSPEAPPLWGLEDKTAYERNIQAFKDSLARAPKLRALLTELKTTLARLKDKDYSPSLKEFDRHFNAYKERQENLGDYTRYLAAADPSRTPPNVRRLLDALAMEASLDFKAVERERTALVEELARKLSPGDLNRLVEQSVNYRTGRMAGGAYYRDFKELCRKYGIGPERYGRLTSYIGYVLSAGKINRNDLLTELNVLEERVPESLAKTAEQKRLIAADRGLAQLQELANHSMTPQDWAAYLKTRDNVLRLPEELAGLGVVAQFIGRSPERPNENRPMNRRSHAALPASAVGATTNDLEALLKPCEDFCRCAVERNNALAENLFKKLSELKTSGTQPTAILVAGGFHTEGLTDILKQRNASYVVMTPNITEIPKTNNYLDAFARDPLPLEKLLDGEAVDLSLPLVTCPANEGGRSSRFAVVWAVLEFLWNKFFSDGKEGDSQPLTVNVFHNGEPVPVRVTAAFHSGTQGNAPGEKITTTVAEKTMTATIVPYRSRLSALRAAVSRTARTFGRWSVRNRIFLENIGLTALGNAAFYFGIPGALPGLLLIFVALHVANLPGDYARAQRLAPKRWTSQNPPLSFRALYFFTLFLGGAALLMFLSMPGLIHVLNGAIPHWAASVFGALFGAGWLTHGPYSQWVRRFLVKFGFAPLMVADSTAQDHRYFADANGIHDVVWGNVWIFNTDYNHGFSLLSYSLRTSGDTDEDVNKKVEEQRRLFEDAFKGHVGDQELGPLEQRVKTAVMESIKSQEMNAQAVCAEVFGRMIEEENKASRDKNVRVLKFLQLNLLPDLLGPHRLNTDKERKAEIALLNIAADSMKADIVKKIADIKLARNPIEIRLKDLTDAGIDSGIRFKLLSATITETDKTLKIQEKLRDLIDDPTMGLPLARELISKGNIPATRAINQVFLKIIANIDEQDPALPEIRHFGWSLINRFVRTKYIRKDSDDEKRYSERVADEQLRFSKAFDALRKTLIFPPGGRVAQFVDELATRVPSEISRGFHAQYNVLATEDRFEGLHPDETPEENIAILAIVDALLKDLEPPEEALVRNDEPEVLVINGDIDPDWFEKQLNTRNIVAVISTKPQVRPPHWFLTAQERGIVVVVGVDAELFRELHPGETISADGLTGEVIKNPSASTIENLKIEQLRRRVMFKVASRTATSAAATVDGVPVKFLTNVDRIEDDHRKGFESSVGLSRTDTLFYKADKDERSPTAISDDELKAMEDGWRARFRDIANKYPGAYTLRMLDRNTNERTKSMNILPPSQRNLQGADYLLDDPVGQRVAFYELRAIMRAYLESPNIQVSIPMVSTMEHVAKIKALRKEVADSIAMEYAEGPERDEVAGKLKALRLGYMVETPLGITNLEEISESADFVSIGTNDLTRLRAAEAGIEGEVSFSELNPQILLDIFKTAVAYQRRNAADGGKRTVTICGDLAHQDIFLPFIAMLNAMAAEEVASSPGADGQPQIPLAVGLSMPNPQIPIAKAIIRRLDAKVCFEKLSKLFEPGSKMTAKELNDKSKDLVNEAMLKMKAEPEYQAALAAENAKNAPPAQPTSPAAVPGESKGGPISTFGEKVIPEVVNPLLAIFYPLLLAGGTLYNDLLSFLASRGHADLAETLRTSQGLSLTEFQRLLVPAMALSEVTSIVLRAAKFAAAPNVEAQDFIIALDSAVERLRGPLGLGNLPIRFHAMRGTAEAERAMRTESFFLLTRDRNGGVDVYVHPAVENRLRQDAIDEGVTFETILDRVMFHEGLELMGVSHENAEIHGFRKGGLRTRGEMLSAYERALEERAGRAPAPETATPQPVPIKLVPASAGPLSRAEAAGRLMRDFLGGTPSAQTPHLFPLVESPGLLTAVLGTPGSEKEWSDEQAAALRSAKVAGQETAVTQALDSALANTTDGQPLESLVKRLPQGTTLEAAARLALARLESQALNAQGEQPATPAVLQDFLTRGANLLALLDQLSDGQEARWREFLSTAEFLIGRQPFLNDRQALAENLNRAVEPYRNARRVLAAYGSDRQALMISLIQGTNNLVLEVPTALLGTENLQGADLAQANLLAELSRWLEQGNPWPADRKILFLVEGREVTTAEVLSALNRRGLSTAGLDRIAATHIKTAGSLGIEGYLKNGMVSGKAMFDYMEKPEVGLVDRARNRGVDVFALKPWSEEGLSESQKLAVRIILILGGGVAKAASEDMMKALQEKAKNDFIKIMA
jgi:phosphoenolpyruvate-protein kinase (PTS system EI component)